ncbi:hypothetical protein M0805_006772 [Coniferiporia weirii]|nr:hypothetical protein M0805_006772 [Coniferiporia weirii]
MRAAATAGRAPMASAPFKFAELPPLTFRTSTLIAIVALSIHDIIDIVSVTIFGVIHWFNDGFTYGQSFWFTVCSTVALVVTNATLIVDYVRTPDFARSSSGLSRRQRSLVIVVMILLVCIAIGSLVNLTYES